MTDAQRERNRKLGAQLVRNLKDRHFQAYYCDTAAQAKEKALSLIPAGHVVAWGGSSSLEEIGILSELRNGAYSVIDRDQAQSPKERVELMRRGLLADTYLASANAISEDGQLVNVDGNGNRVAAITYGPSNVILVVGMNKVTPSVEEAVSRARNVAAPINAQRFSLQTPCGLTGSCGDCTGTQSICAFISTIRLCRPAGRIQVVLVGESLGF